MGMKINAHLPIPADLKAEYPLSSQILKLKEKRDREIREIFEGKSDKFLVIVWQHARRTMKIPYVSMYRNWRQSTKKYQIA